MRADTGLRQEIAAGRQALWRGYLERPNPRLLLRRHAQLIDRTVKALWEGTGVPAGSTLVATGGYGRSELFPNSDIDLLVLLAREPGGEERESLERLIGALWDAGPVHAPFRAFNETVLLFSSDCLSYTIFRRQR